MKVDAKLYYSKINGVIFLVVTDFSTKNSDPHFLSPQLSPNTSNWVAVSSINNFLQNLKLIFR